jgi:hypothetical protein
MRNQIACPDDVFRDELKQSRSNYFVSYSPADCRQPEFAILNLTFQTGRPSNDHIRRYMEEELLIWLNRFPVPLMVSSFDESDSFLHLSDRSDDSILMGYIDPNSGAVVSKWALLRQDQLPAAQLSKEYLQKIYTSVPTRLRREVELAAEEKNRQFRKALLIVKSGFIFVAAVPLLIEMVSWGIAWVGYLLQAVSVITGGYKIGRAAGWIPQTSAAKAKAEKMRKMEHYFYHCEKNPEGFLRLKVQNFERDAKEGTAKEAAALKNSEEGQTLSSPQLKQQSALKTC